MPHNRILLFYGSTCALFELPPLQACELLDHPTHTNFAPVWTHDFETGTDKWPRVRRLLDDICYPSGTVVLTWSQQQRHFQIVLSGSHVLPHLIQLEALTFQSSADDQIARSRTVIPHRDGFELMLITNQVGDCISPVSLPQELQSLILPDEQLTVGKMAVDEGTGRVCFTSFRYYKTLRGAMKSRGLADFIVVLDFM